MNRKHLQIRTANAPSCSCTKRIGVVVCIGSLRETHLDRRRRGAERSRSERSIKGILEERRSFWAKTLRSISYKVTIDATTEERREGRNQIIASSFVLLLSVFCQFPFGSSPLSVSRTLPTWCSRSLCFFSRSYRRNIQTNIPVRDAML